MVISKERIDLSLFHFPEAAQRGPLGPHSPMQEVVGFLNPKRTEWGATIQKERNASLTTVICIRPFLVGDRGHRNAYRGYATTILRNHRGW